MVRSYDLIFQKSRPRWSLTQIQTKYKTWQQRTILRNKIASTGIRKDRQSCKSKSVQIPSLIDSSFYQWLLTGLIEMSQTEWSEIGQDKFWTSLQLHFFERFLCISICSQQWGSNYLTKSSMAKNFDMMQPPHLRKNLDGK